MGVIETMGNGNLGIIRIGSQFVEFSATIRSSLTLIVVINVAC